MAPYAYALRKGRTWRGGLEEWTNVYHYDSAAAVPTEDGFRDLLLAIRAQEVPIHNVNVSFLGGRAWGPTNQGQAANITRLITDYNGIAGTQGGTQIPPEFTVYASWFMGRNSATGRKTFLRKYYHLCSLATADGLDTYNGIAPLSASNKGLVKTRLDNLKTLTIGPNTNDLCKPDGTHGLIGEEWKVGDHLHVRQFKQ